MIAAKVCDDVTWKYYTTTLVTSNRHNDALRIAEEKGILYLFVLRMKYRINLKIYNIK